MVFKVFRIGNLIHSPCAAAEVTGTRYCFLICRSNGNNSTAPHTHARVGEIVGQRGHTSVIKII